jgi:hypothetical protein
MRRGRRECDAVVIYRTLDKLTENNPDIRDEPVAFRSAPYCVGARLTGTTRTTLAIVHASLGTT